mgnify:CR=1 FL=1
MQTTLRKPHAEALSEKENRLGTSAEEERDPNNKKEGPSLPPCVIAWIETHGEADD